eukprot:3164216-Amphidinium_carterae.1
MVMHQVNVGEGEKLETKEHMRPKNKDSATNIYNDDKPHRIDASRFLFRLEVFLSHMCLKIGDPSTTCCLWQVFFDGVAFEDRGCAVGFCASVFVSSTTALISRFAMMQYAQRFCAYQTEIEERDVRLAQLL